MLAAIEQLNRGRLDLAERLARGRLAEQPNDVAALCMVADLAARAGVLPEAERLLRRALELAPGFAEAQLNLAKLLARRDGIVEAIAILDDLLRDLPERVDIALFRLALLGQTGDYSFAARGYSELLGSHSERAEVWVAKGHLQNTMGDLAGSIDSYRRAIAIESTNGEAWWGLANLKTYKFETEEIARLGSIVEALDGAPSSRSGLLHFAYAKGLADSSDDAGAFNQYQRGNAICYAAVGDDGCSTSAEVDRSIALFTASRFASAASSGHQSREPIFILGLPRSGSTLVEQILASHPLVEGTSELPYIPMLAHRLLAERWEDRTLRFPDMLDEIPLTRLHEIGQAYLDAAAAHRHAGRPFFIDKLPNNWRYVGFIRLILPKARIIDTRREVMACLWSNFCQWFARGQEWSYDFASLARTWHDYRRLMDHFNGVLPGAVQRVGHEALIADPERVIRKLLDDLALPFDAACLNFHENDRPVRTASAQQVRRPIERNAAHQWRRFERWLEPLKTELAGWGEY